MNLDEILPSLINRYDTDSKINKSVHWNTHLYYTIHTSYRIAKRYPLQFDMRKDLWERPDRLLLCAYSKKYFNNRFSPVAGIRDYLIACKELLEEIHQNNQDLYLANGLRIWRDRPEGAWKNLCETYSKIIIESNSLKNLDSRIFEHVAFKNEKNPNLHLSKWISEMGENDDPISISVGFRERLRLLPYFIASKEVDLTQAATKVLAWDSLFTSTNSYKHGGQQVLAPVLGNEKTEYLFSIVDRWFKGDSLEQAPFVVLGKEGDRKHDHSKWSVISELFGFINFRTMPYINKVNKELYEELGINSTMAENSNPIKNHLNSNQKLVKRLAGMFDGLKTKITPPRTRIRGIEKNKNSKLMDIYDEKERLIFEVDKIYDEEFDQLPESENEIEKATMMTYLLLDAHCYAVKEQDSEVEYNDDDDEIIRTEEASIHSFKNQIKQPINQILFGPPGTGKTYNSVYKALEIIDGELPTGKDEAEKRQKAMNRFKKLKSEGRIETLTFHQSFSYEDFIEGIRPIINDTTDQVTYKVTSGIFKKYVEKIKAVNSGNMSQEIDESAQVWRVSLGDINHFEDCLKEGSIGIDYGITEDLTEVDLEEHFNTLQTQRGKQSFALFRDQIAIGDIVCIFNDASSIKAVGIITGDFYFEKTKDRYSSRRKVRWIDKRIHNISKINGGKKMMTPAIHRLPNISPYELMEMVSTNQPKTPQRIPFVLIIDEINRGNLSRIFGELITLIESDKREGKINEVTSRLPYSDKPFSVPDNLFIIGTMNTADRTIAIMDFALRRRFKFQYFGPNETLVPETVEDLPLRDLFTKINKKIELSLGRDYMLGHSFFIGIENLKQLHEVWYEQILPLLAEYYFDDLSRLEEIIPGFMDDAESGTILSTYHKNITISNAKEIDTQFAEQLKKCA